MSWKKENSFLYFFILTLDMHNVAFCFGNNLVVIGTYHPALFLMTTKL